MFVNYSYDTWHPKLVRIMTIWLGREPDREDYYDFAKFIGFPQILSEQKWIVNWDLPEVQHIILTLDGPHIKTLLKVMELKNSRKKDKEYS